MSALSSTDVAAIRGQLSKSRQQLTTLNLLVWIADEGVRDWVLTRATLVAEKHPSRTIVLDAASGRTGATVHVAGDEHDTESSARVVIGASDLNAAEICELTLSLLAPDVPTVLFWSGAELSPETGFACLAECADAAVIDSSLAVRDSTTINELAQFYASRQQTALRDLAWLRLRPWQDMIAHFFDDPHLAEELFAIRRLEIVSGSEAEALYLGGWLGSRLGWRASAHDRFSDRNGNEIVFDHARDGEPRRIRSVALRTGTTVYQGAVTDDESVVRMWAEGRYASEPRLFPLQNVDNASLLERAVLETGTDEIFETALRTVSTLLA